MKTKRKAKARRMWAIHGGIEGKSAMLSSKRQSRDDIHVYVIPAAELEQCVEQMAQAMYGVIYITDFWHDEDRDVQNQFRDQARDALASIGIKAKPATRGSKERHG